jgi:CheY-like chemotaxis protein
MLGIALRAAGFDSHLCTDGREALDRLEAGLEPDVVLMDIRMPRMGGAELARRIREEPRWDLIPLVAMSAYSDDVQEHEIKAAGADAFLPKPFTIVDLRSMLNSVLPRDRRSRG